MFRYQKGDRVRTYGLRVLDDDSAELWVRAEHAGRETAHRKLTTLMTMEETDPLLESIKQELRAGGWSEV
jgi:hypothetical protein